MIESGELEKNDDTLNMAADELYQRLLDIDQVQEINTNKLELATTVDIGIGVARRHANHANKKPGSIDGLYSYSDAWIEADMLEDSDQVDKRGAIPAAVNNSFPWIYPGELDQETAANQKREANTFAGLLDSSPLTDNSSSGD